MAEEQENKIVVFKHAEIRRQFFHGEWWFVIRDIIIALTDTVDATSYLRDMRRRDPQFEKLYVKGGGQIDPPLALSFDTPGGIQKLKAWNTEGIFRLVQSIPSPKAEPFKRWLARVGYERVQEIENPELAQKRMRMTYKLKGYSDEWIQRRERGIATRNDLTDEWDKRGIEGEQDYAILTAEISKGTFDMTPSQIKKHKGLKTENLRDHMDAAELLFTELGELATTRIAQVDDAQGLPENAKAAKEGGQIAGNARRALEKRTGNKVLTQENYKNQSEIEQRKKRLELENDSNAKS